MKKTMSACWMALTLGLFLFGGSGCKKAVGDQEAVRQTVWKHLTGNSSLNLAAMDTSFEQIQVNGEKAEADVLFRLKQGGATMQIAYFLERHAGDWVVLRSQPVGGEIAHPPMDKTHAMPASDNGSLSFPDLRSFSSTTPAHPPTPAPPAPGKPARDSSANSAQKTSQ
jgi:hypothetical protein